MLSSASDKIHAQLIFKHTVTENGERSDNTQL